MCEMMAACVCSMCVCLLVCLGFCLPKIVQKQFVVAANYSYGHEMFAPIPVNINSNFNLVPDCWCMYYVQGVPVKGPKSLDSSLGLARIRS